MRAQELNWLFQHPKEMEKYSGKWVAVSGRRIVAAGNSVSGIGVILKKKNLSWNEVMLMKVPRKDEEMSIL